MGGTLVKQVPHHAIVLVDKPGTGDQHTPFAFRHYIEIPDDVFPQGPWRNAGEEPEDAGEDTEDAPSRNAGEDTEEEEDDEDEEDEDELAEEEEEDDEEEEDEDEEE